MSLTTSSLPRLLWETNWTLNLNYGQVLVSGRALVNRNRSSICDPRNGIQLHFYSIESKEYWLHNQKAIDCASLAVSATMIKGGNPIRRGRGDRKQNKRVLARFTSLGTPHTFGFLFAASGALCRCHNTARARRAFRIHYTAHPALNTAESQRVCAWTAVRVKTRFVSASNADVYCGLYSWLA